MQIRKDLIPYGAALLSMIFWSFSFVWVKIAYLAYQPMTVVVIRLLISSAFVIGFSVLFRKLQGKRQALAGMKGKQAS